MARGARRTAFLAVARDAALLALVAAPAFAQSQPSASNFEQSGSTAPPPGGEGSSNYRQSGNPEAK